VRRAWILAISLLAVLVLLIGMGAGACGGNGDENGTPSPGEEAEAPLPEEEEPTPSEEEEETPPAVLPAPGVWVASIDIGEFWFRVNADSTAITLFGWDTPQGFKCGDIELFECRQGGTWHITDGQFTIETETGGQYGPNWGIVIRGSFDETCTHASGTLAVNVEGETCPAGTWEASPSS
jgi:hypothetical protein